MRALTLALLDLLDLLVPRRCRGCGRPGAHCCPACAAALVGPARPVRPDPAPEGLPEVWSAATYDGSTRRLLLHHKDRGGWALSPLLGSALARTALAALQLHRTPVRSPWLVVPMPSAAAATRRRGYDHAARLARSAAAHLLARGITARSAPVLRLTRDVADQSGLTAAQRAANLRGSLAARTPLPGARVLLVDDVMTTGASLTEASRALRAAGAEQVLAVVVARTVRRTTRKPDVGLPAERRRV